MAFEKKKTYQMPDMEFIPLQLDFIVMSGETNFGGGEWGANDPGEW